MRSDPPMIPHPMPNEDLNKLVPYRTESDDCYLLIARLTMKACRPAGACWIDRGVGQFDIYTRNAVATDTKPLWWSREALTLPEYDTWD